MVEEGKFREDLYFRIKVFTIAIHPFRERKVDIPVLIQHFIHMKQKEMKLPWVQTVAPNAIDRLLEYAWPGNIRELQNAVERVLIHSDGNPLFFDDILPSKMKNDRKNVITSEEIEVFKLADMEIRHISIILNKVNGRVEGEGGAADLLGLNPSTLRARIKKLGIPFGKNRHGIE